MIPILRFAVKRGHLLPRVVGILHFLVQICGQSLAATYIMIHTVYSIGLIHDHSDGSRWHQ